MANLLIGVQSPYLTRTADNSLELITVVLSSGYEANTNLIPYYEASDVKTIRFAFKWFELHSNIGSLIKWKDKNLVVESVY